MANSLKTCTKIDVTWFWYKFLGTVQESNSYLPLYRTCKDLSPAKILIFEFA